MQRTFTRHVLPLCLLTAPLYIACAEDDSYTDPVPSSGGASSGTGGGSGSGGRVSAGGASSSGGRVSAGGASSSGGRVSAGGASSSGGAPASAGGAASGGASAGGAASGGASAGGAASGGASSGGASSGGASSGGASSGGASSGGASSDGGASSAGGASSDGGASSTDAGPPDASVTDASVTDASVTDAGGDAGDGATGSPNVVVNEIESSAVPPGDWIELFNAGTTAADVSGWILRDENTTPSYVFAGGTTIAAGAYLVVEDADLGFSLGRGDSARLFAPDGTTLVDSYTWTEHAANGTYRRCPDGSGAFVDGSVSKGATNACQ